MGRLLGLVFLLLHASCSNGQIHKIDRTGWIDPSMPFIGTLGEKTGEVSSTIHSDPPGVDQSASLLDDMERNVGGKMDHVLSPAAQMEDVPINDPCICEENSATSDTLRPFIRRFLKLLSNRLQDIETETVYIGYFKFNQDFLQLLNSAGTGGFIEAKHLHQLEQILSTSTLSFEPATTPYFLALIAGYLGNSLLQYFQVACGCLFVLVLVQLTFKLTRLRFTLPAVFFSICLSSILQSWIHLYQGMSSIVKSFSDYLSTFVSYVFVHTEPCEQYIREMETDAVFEVSLLEAITHTATTALIPIARSFKNIVIALFKDLPWPLWCVMLVLLVLLFVYVIMDRLIRDRYKIGNIFFSVGPTALPPQPDVQAFIPPETSITRPIEQDSNLLPLKSVQNVGVYDEDCSSVIRHVVEIDVNYAKHFSKHVDKPTSVNNKSKVSKSARHKKLPSTRVPPKSSNDKMYDVPSPNDSISCTKMQKEDSVLEDTTALPIYQSTSEETDITVSSSDVDKLHDTIWLPSAGNKMAEAVGTAPDVNILNVEDNTCTHLMGCGDRVFSSL